MVSAFHLVTKDALAAPAPFESGGRRCEAAEAQLVGDFFPQSNVVEFQASLHFYAWDNNAGRVFLKYDGRDARTVSGQNLESLEYLDDFIVYKNDLYWVQIPLCIGVFTVPVPVPGLHSFRRHRQALRQLDQHGRDPFE